MNDPWEVKAVRQGNQYQSCMRLNGVPLLPPVLSKECRKEMQYYKLLAKEVEKRISILQPYVNDDDEDSNEDATDALELTECEHYDVDSKEEVKKDLEVKNITISATAKADNILYNNDSQLHIDFNVKIARDKLPCSPKSPKSPLYLEQARVELPERDCDSTMQKQLKEMESNRKHFIDDIINDCNDYEIPLSGPSSLSVKSFTGSLTDLHIESKESPTLTRQRSYTLLKPSPQLLAHLKVQSESTGVDVNAISMSESTSNLSPNSKKRRSWDLETAKVKWSSMALDLRNKFSAKKNASTNKVSKDTQKIQQYMSKSDIQDRPKRNIVSPYAKTPKTEPLQRTKPVTKATNINVVKEPSTPTDKTLVSSESYVISKGETSTPNEVKTVALISETPSPAVRVKELYEKLQKQQLLQMNSLMEKQKREQQLMQQVFREQNSILLKQLKTVCPKASIEVKQAWVDRSDDAERGPVSLSQLIHSPETSACNSPVAKTLTETSKCISKCDNILRKSRDLSSSIKNPQPRITNGANNSMGGMPIMQSPNKVPNRTRSPTSRNASRRLNYDTSLSSDYEPMLTDRTNDTMADLNVTFPSDNSEEDCSNTEVKNTVATPDFTQNATSVVLKVENDIQNSANRMGIRTVTKHSILHRAPTSQELVAAGRIVACARGYLVRRLMRTDRVRATVQTIRDALLCALQLHQDREGIRGADVDLHRRLIQQITAACYSLHDTFVASSAADRCALIAADRARKKALAQRQSTPPRHRRSFVSEASSHVQSNRSRQTLTDEETFSSEKVRARYLPSPQRRPWR